jgi:hypothetical protein
MDITADFGSAVPGSSPGGGTRIFRELCYDALRSGYGLVVKRVLAKDESGVRFSLSAPKNIKTRSKNPRSHLDFIEVRPRVFVIGRMIPELWIKLLILGIKDIIS